MTHAIPNITGAVRALAKTIDQGANGMLTQLVKVGDDEDLEPHEVLEMVERLRIVAQAAIQMRKLLVRAP